MKRLFTTLAAVLVSACSTVANPTRTPADTDVYDDPADAAFATPAPAPPATLVWSPAVAPALGAAASALPPAAPWTHTVFPGKRASTYQPVLMDGRQAMGAQSHSSASMLRQPVRVEAADLNRLRFAWKVPALIAAADLAQRDLDDSPVRVVLAFEGDRSKFSAKNALLSELTHAFTGEPMPYATLMYVWSNQRQTGSVVINPRSDRVRKLVLESGPGNLNRWLDYDRDIRADFELAFGEAPGALLAVGIMTDSDNTLSNAQAWYGPVQVLARQPARPAARQP
jgi:hypothetical protein